MLNGVPSFSKSYSIRSSLSVITALVMQTHRGFALISSVHASSGGIWGASDVGGAPVSVGWSVGAPIPPGSSSPRIIASAMAPPPRMTTSTAMAARIGTRLDPLPEPKPAPPEPGPPVPGGPGGTGGAPPYTEPVGGRLTGADAPTEALPIAYPPEPSIGDGAGVGVGVGT